MSSGAESSGHFEPPPFARELAAARLDGPMLELAKFDWLVLPRTNDAGELVGAELRIGDPSWPLGGRLLFDRLGLVELATGILVLVDSYPDDTTKGGVQSDRD